MWNIELFCMIIKAVEVFRIPNNAVGKCVNSYFKYIFSLFLN
jgi:hypothetical protein